MLWGLLERAAVASMACILYQTQLGMLYTVINFHLGSLVASNARSVYSCRLSCCLMLCYVEEQGVQF